MLSLATQRYAIVHMLNYVEPILVNRYFFPREVVMHCPIVNRCPAKDVPKELDTYPYNDPVAINRTTRSLKSHTR
jgi:hypothetical protein